MRKPQSYTIDESVIIKLEMISRLWKLNKSQTVEKLIKEMSPEKTQELIIDIDKEIQELELKLLNS